MARVNAERGDEMDPRSTTRHPCPGLIAWAEQPFGRDDRAAAGCAACRAEPFAVEAPLGRIGRLRPKRG